MEPHTGNIQERWMERRRSKRRVSVPELGKMAIRGNRTVQEHRRMTLYNLPA
jgi:hypothetical protein